MTNKTNIRNKNGNDEKWNQWFAGLTDGDGTFYISKKEKSVSFEITTDITDARVLYSVKNRLKAGTVKLRSGSNSVRYRVKQKIVILDIIKRLQGNLHNPIRILQFKQVCNLYNVIYIEPPSFISKNDGYLSGLIDSDGSFAISVTNSSTADSQISGVEGRIIRLKNARGFSQISLKVTSSHKAYLELIKKSYGYGSIYIEKANIKNRNPNVKYHWTVKSEEAFQLFYEYLKKNPLRSVKMHRARLSLLYFKYKSLGYHLKQADTIESKIWAKFAKSWYKYSF